MVAVLTVFANHLWGWPHGGFIGVDVFFVISGFLITGNLLRDAEKRGTVSFRQFYWNRVRRIVPAASVVLLLTYLGALVVFLPFRAHEVGIDAVWAFVFLSNWWFGYQGTDYFRAAADTVSPVQHYWSLSIEEQFYFVWPALIFLISVVVVRKVWSHRRRMQLAGAVMAVIVAMSLGWALYQTATAPSWAYFNTFARVWELGVGALLACAVGLFARLPDILRPWMSGAGLGLIAASVMVIREGAVGFPAPWAILPVAGSALVIAAGVGQEPRYQAFLRNPASVYIGDISYSLYLVHWPVIILVGAIMNPGISYTVTVLALGFGLAIASYHFVENPLRRADWTKFRSTLREIRRRSYQTKRSSRIAGLAVLACVAVAATTFALRPDAYRPTIPPLLAEPVPVEGVLVSEPQLGPLTSALQAEIATALQATDWPPLTPSLESIATDPAGQEAVFGCYGNEPLTNPSTCSWGPSTAPTRVVIVGDSIAGSYAPPLREIADASGGNIQVYTLALGGCEFANDLVQTDDVERMTACPGRKQAAIDYINSTQPQVVIVANTYAEKRVVGSDEEMTPGEWSDSLRLLVDQFRSSVGKIVFLSPPPVSPLIGECYGKRGSVPGDCVGRVTRQWLGMADAERGLAESIGGAWVDARLWFCASGSCPSFVGSTPTKLDATHMVPAYGVKIAPVIQETFRDQAGVL